MSLHTITVSDADNGRRFQAWVDEFIYSIGRWCNFDGVMSQRGCDLVVDLVCIPADWADFGREGIHRKLADREIWSSRRVAFEEFVSGVPERIIVCIKSAFVEAIEQFRKNDLPIEVKRTIIDAAEKAAEFLAKNPDRFPR